MGVTVPEYRDRCHCEYQGTGMGVTVSIRVQGWVSL